MRANSNANFSSLIVLHGWTKDAISRKQSGRSISRLVLFPDPVTNNLCTAVTQYKKLRINTYDHCAVHSMQCVTAAVLLCKLLVCR